MQCIFGDTKTNDQLTAVAAGHDQHSAESFNLTFIFTNLHNFPTLLYRSLMESKKAAWLSQTLVIASRFKQYNAIKYSRLQLCRPNSVEKSRV